MELKLGKYYKTRDGRKARVICDDLKTLNGCRFIALVSRHNSTMIEDTVYYDIAGRIGSRESEYDLISEWVDKPEFDWSKSQLVDPELRTEHRKMVLFASKQKAPSSNIDHSDYSDPGVSSRPVNRPRASGVANPPK